MPNYTPFGLFPYIEADLNGIQPPLQSFQDQVEARIIALTPGTSGGGLADPGSNGMLARVSTGVAAARTFQQPSAGLTISNPSGASGNPTWALADDLLALENLSTIGRPKRIGVSTWTISAIDLTAEVSGILASANGGTGNGFAKFAGPASSEKTFTLPNASAMILTDAAVVTVAQGGIGVGTLAINSVLYGNGTSAVQALAVNASGTNKFLTQLSSAAPTWATIAASDLPGGFSGFGNPTATVGPSAANGSATTAMRSDSAPAISLTAAYPWTGLHQFLLGPMFGDSTIAGNVYPTINAPAANEVGLAFSKAGNQKWLMYMASNSNDLNLYFGTNLVTFQSTGTALFGSGTTKLALSGGVLGVTSATTNDNLVARAKGTSAVLVGYGDGSGGLSVYDGGTINNARFTNSAGNLTITPSGSRVEVAASLFVNSGTANLYFKDTSTGWQSASSTIVTPQSGNSLRNTSFTSGLSGWNITDAGRAEFSDILARGELRAFIFKINELSATAGTQGIFYSASSLNADSTTAPTNTTFTFDGRNSDDAAMLFGIGDIVRFKAFVNSNGNIIGDTWATITARTNHSTYTTYTAYLDSGSTSTVFRAGTAIADYGPSGTGFITLSADGTVGASPNLTMGKHSGTPWNGFTTLLRMGNLNGSYGYGSDVYGFATGQYGVGGQPWISVETTNGVRIGNNVTTVFQVDTSGVQTIGQVAAGQSNIRLSSGALDLRVDTTIRTHLATDGSGYFANSAFAFDTSGNVSITGNATIASWTIAAARISSANVFIDQAGQYLSMGTSPPTSYGSNVGVFIEGANSGRLSLYKDTNNFLQWDNSKLIWKAANSALDSSGNLTVNAGLIGGWTINSTAIQNSGATVMLRGAGSLAFGSTPPTSASAGTGLFLDSTGMYGLLASIVQTKFDAAIGAITAGAGSVKLDASGVYVVSGATETSTKSYQNVNTSGALISSFGGYFDASDNLARMRVWPIASRSSTLYLETDNPSGAFNSDVFIRSLVASAAKAEIHLSGSSSIDFKINGTSQFQIQSGFLSAGSAFTTLTNSAGKILSAALNTVAVGQGGTGATTFTANKLLKGNTTSAFSSSQIYDDGTYVGLGMTSPGQLLSVGQGNGVNIQIADWASIGCTYSSAATMIGMNAMANTSGSAGMHIIGTNGALGAQAIQMYYAEGITFHTVSGSVTAGNSFSSERMRIDNSGTIRFNAYGAGTLITDGSGNISASSDRKLKNLIEPYSRGLELLREFQPWRYTWKPGNYTDDTSTIYTGFIIDDKLERIMPEAVMRGKIYRNLWDRAITSAHHNAILQLDRRDDELQKQILDLSSQLAGMKNELDALRRAA